MTTPTRTRSPRSHLYTELCLPSIIIFFRPEMSLLHFSTSISCKLSTEINYANQLITYANEMLMHASPVAVVGISAPSSLRLIQLVLYITYVFLATLYLY